MTMPIEELKGMTLKLVGDNKIEIMYHAYLVTSPYDLAKMEQMGSDVIKEVVNQLKKRFKKVTKKTLKLTKKDGQFAYEKVGKTCGEVSGMFGQGTKSIMNNPVGRFLLREKTIYEYSID
jgi:hypothetical protein